MPPPAIAAIMEKAEAYYEDLDSSALFGGGEGETAVRRLSAAERSEQMYKTKVVEFLGRTTSIVLQNENGPCPLLAICNVLLLRNVIQLGIDGAEVSQQQLLSLVAERLIDSNSNVQGADNMYADNQFQNIGDAIDLLPCLATGLDVNVLFRKINDFEFTRECTIFDLLDIPLYHGWIVDPQDTETAAAIGSKSYNTIAAELVLGRSKLEGQQRKEEEEDCIDFAAATTAALGVPSPSLSRGVSFNAISRPNKDGKRQDNLGEQNELNIALNQIASDFVSTPGAAQNPSSSNTELINYVETARSLDPADSVKLITQIENNETILENSVCGRSMDAFEDGTSMLSSESNGIAREEVQTKNIEKPMESTFGNSSDGLCISNDIGGSSSDLDQSTSETSVGHAVVKKYENSFGAANKEQTASAELSGDVNEPNEATSNGHAERELSENTQGSVTDEEPASFSFPHAVDDAVTVSYEKIAPSVLDAGDEPIYQGEEHVLKAGQFVYENSEPVYEGEMTLREQTDRADKGVPPTNASDAHVQLQIISNFLEHNASQLTIYGLFCLQEGLNERELCVFFRNNHFNTMFKYNGELYLLVTDQGYINQPDLVWEKLNEVNGDTVYMTANFSVFSAAERVADPWSEQDAVNSTADYISKLGGSAKSTEAMNSDLQLAIALQQQELENQHPRGNQSHSEHQPQQQRLQQHLSQQQQSQYPERSSPSSHQGLVVGPQTSRYQSGQPRNESKPLKEKCTVM